MEINYKTLKNHINPKYWILIVAAIFFILTSFFSEGYLHADEHWQILEPANAIFNNGELGSQLPWEFSQKIRPGFMPFIVYTMLKVGKIFGFEQDRYLFVFIIRLINCIFCYLVIYQLYMYWRLKLVHHQSKILLLGFSFLIWWIPFISARFSSDVFGGALFALGWLIWEKYKSGKFTLPMVLISGLLLGLSFQARYQMAFGIFFLIGFELFSKFKYWKGIIILIFGGLISLIFGFLFDFWLYNEWIFPPINYFVINILDGKAAEFGTAPFYWYFIETFNQSVPIFGIIILLAIIASYFKQKLNSEKVIFGGFIIIHSLISHKELRFIFPMLFFIPYFVSFFFDKFRIWKYSNKVAFKIILVILLIFNIGLLIYNGTKAIITPFEFVHFFQKEVKKNNYPASSNIPLIYLKDANGEGAFLGFFKPFYGKIPCNTTNKNTELKISDYIFIHNIKDLDSFKKFGEVIYSHPNPILFEYNYNNWISRTPQYYLIKIKK